MSIAPALVLREGDRKKLADLARLPSVPSGLAKRARLILLAADGVPNAEIARLTGVSRPTVIGWRDWCEAGGIAALEDAPRSGQSAEIDEIEVIAATLADSGKPPGQLGITHWSARFLASELGISFATVARIWRKWGIQPHRIETFESPTDPQLEAKIRDVVGLYLAPGQRRRGVRGREVTDPGAEPDRADAAAAAGGPWSRVGRRTRSGARAGCGLWMQATAHALALASAVYVKPLPSQTRHRG